MTVRTRLVLTLGGMTILLMLPSLYSASRLAELSAIAEEVRTRHAGASASLGRLRTSLAELERFQRSYIAAPSAELRQGMQQALHRARQEFFWLLDAGFGDMEDADALTRSLDDLEQANARIVDLMEANRVDDATAYFQQVRPILVQARAAVEGVTAEADRRAADDVAEAESISDAARRTTLLSAAVALAAALLLGGWTTRALTSPLQRLRAAMASVAGGKFVAPRDLPYRRQDEIGDLSASFRAMTQQLAELERMKAEFVSIASHELKTPLNVISGYVELAGEGIYGELNEKQREVLNSIHHQAQVLAGLVDQLLDVSRLEAGGFRIEPADMHVAALLESLARDFEPLARRKSIDFVVEADGSSPESVVADQKRLRHEVLGNLLSNAFKFTPEAGRIHVKAWGERDVLVLAVSDSGEGIPAEHLPHVFDKYYQVGDRAREIGAGLGLAIAREVVEAHGGSIEAESAPGQGTTFRIRLPRAPVASVSAPAPAS